MVGMGVVQDPAVLGDLGTVVNLQESTRTVPSGPISLVCQTCRPVEVRFYILLEAKANLNTAKKKKKGIHGSSVLEVIKHFGKPVCLNWITMSCRQFFRSLGIFYLFIIFFEGVLPKVLALISETG